MSDDLVVLDELNEGFALPRDIDSSEVPRLRFHEIEVAASIFLSYSTDCGRIVKVRKGRFENDLREAGVFAHDDPYSIYPYVESIPTLIDYGYVMAGGDFFEPTRAFLERCNGVEVEGRKIYNVARFIFLNSEDRVLFLERSQKEDYKQGELCLPGGKQKQGRTIQESGIEEVFEETNFRISNVRFLFIDDRLPNVEEGRQGVNFYFTADYSGELRPNEESERAFWLSEDEMRNYDIAFGNREAVAKYLREFRA